MVRCLQAERCWHQTSTAVIGQKEETQRLAEEETRGQQQIISSVYLQTLTI